MSKRKTISPAIQAQVLDACRRRCCICFALNGDIEEKSGQIAHLDHDRSNNTISNLAWLCLDHHNRYDSTTSQSKGLMLLEVKKHQSDLHEAVTSGRVLNNPAPEVFRFSDYLPRSSNINVTGEGNVVSGGDIHLNVHMPTKRRKRSKQPIIPGTVAEDARMIGYLKYLASRYNEFKKWDCDQEKRPMKYPMIYVSYKRDMHYSISNTPVALFDEASAYLQKRIKNTKLGRMKGKHQRLFQLFTNFDGQADANESL